MDFDETDREVLEALTADARASDREIAAETGIVANRVAERRTALEEAGVIEGYTARIDYERIGFDVTAVFRLTVEGDGLDEVVSSLRDAPGVVVVYEVTGEQDVLAIGKYTDTDAMDDRIKDLLIDPNVRSVTTSIVLDAVLEYTNDSLR